MARMGRIQGMVAASALACVAVAGCVADEPPREPVESHQAPLIGGEHDLEDEAVVALLFSNGAVFCTATLISPSVIVTAAHCLDIIGEPTSAIAYFGNHAVDDPGRKSAVGAKKYHPNWNGSINNNPGSVNHDIALLRLVVPQDPKLAIPLTPESPEAHIGEPLRRVGFGRFERESNDIDGMKRVGTTTLHTVPDGPDWFLGGDDMLSTCNGDSGGPAFQTYGDTEYLVGVHSFGYDGSVDCVPPNNGDTRVDLYRDNFILPWIQENDPVCLEDGVCAKIGCTDDPDCRPCGPDGTCTDGCPLPDPDCATQQIGEICQADTQCDTGLCVYWELDPNSKFCSRECDPGNDDCPGGMTCRNFASFGNICYYDDDPDGVLGDTCEQHTDCGSYICEDNRCVIKCDLSLGLRCPAEFECSTTNDADYYCRSLAVDDGGGGGCDAGGSSRGAAFLLVILGALGLALRRRRLR